MALRMMQLQGKISGGLVAGDARTSAGTLLFARPWREWLEKPPLTGSSSVFVEGGAAGWLQELLCFEGSLSPEYAATDPGCRRGAWRGPLPRPVSIAIADRCGKVRGGGVELFADCKGSYVS